MAIIDTNILINLSKNHKPTVQKLKELEAKQQIATTVINAEEFLFGLFDKGKIEERIFGEELLKKLKIYDYTTEEVKIVTELKVELKRQSKRIGDYDEIIAGICIAKNEPLYTINVKHFKQVKGLKLVH